MSDESAVESQSEDVIEVDLRNPILAGVFAWLWPGAGHVYQRRYGKGVLFMACILGTYFFGLFLADGHVVYASLTKEDFRWQYACQLGVGVSALPALVQNYRVRHGQEPLWGGIMAPPRNVVGTTISSHVDYQLDELSNWNSKYHTYFDLGTLYTMIAGLLNVLAIYDAASGPVIYAPAGDKKKKPPGGNPDSDPGGSREDKPDGGKRIT
jgi:hypothetical protein